MKAVFPFVLALVACSANALTLDYNGFYDRLKKVQGVDYPLVSLRFYLNNAEQGRPCNILDGAIIDGEQHWPLVVDKHQSLLLPFDKKLKDNRAVVSMKVEDGAQCDFAMQLLSSDRVQSRFGFNDWQQLVGQFDGALKRFAGFPFSWLQPDVTGVVITLEPGTTFNDNPWLVPSAKPNEYRLLLADMPEDGELRFSQAPRWISPYIAR